MTDTMTKPLSNVLLALLYFAKRDAMQLPDGEKLTWKHVRSALKHADYDQADHMRLGDVLSFLMEAVREATERPDLKVPGRTIENVMTTAIKAPFSGHFAMKWPYWTMSLEDQYPLEDVYNAMFKQMISDLSLTTVAQCAQYVEYSDKRDEEVARVEASFADNSNWLSE